MADTSVGSLMVTTEETVFWGTEEGDRLVPCDTVVVVIDGTSQEVTTGLHALHVYHADFGACFCLLSDLMSVQNNQI